MPQSWGAIFSTTGTSFFTPRRIAIAGRGGEKIPSLFVDEFSYMITHFVCILMYKTSMRKRKIQQKLVFIPLSKGVKMLKMG